jgi:hypothetical protein
MKKLTLTLVAVAAMSLTSCVKSYTCRCTTTGSPGGLTDGYQDAPLKSTKSAAKKSCNKTETSNGITTKCELL